MDEMWISIQCGLLHHLVEGYMAVAISSDYSGHWVVLCTGMFLKPSALTVALQLSSMTGANTQSMFLPKTPWIQTVACKCSGDQTESENVAFLFRKGTLSWLLLGHSAPAWVPFSKHLWTYLPRTLQVPEVGPIHICSSAALLHCDNLLFWVNKGEILMDLNTGSHQAWRGFRKGKTLCCLKPPSGLMCGVDELSVLLLEVLHNALSTTAT